MKDTKVAPGIYKTAKGWRLFVRVRGDDWPADRKGELKPKRLTDPMHKIGIKELRTLLEEWRVEAKQAVDGGKPAITGGTSLRNDLAVYQRLPKFLTTTKENQEQRVMQMTTLINRVALGSGTDGMDRTRLTVTKQEWELALGALFVERKWEPGNYNKWLGALKAFYNALESTTVAEPNPVRKITLMRVPKPEPMNIDYRIILRVLARLKPTSLAGKNKLSFQTESLVWRLAHEGVTNVKLASIAGVSEAAIRKFLRRGPREKARPSEVIYYAFLVQAFTGMRPIQWDNLGEHDFDPIARKVKVRSSKKGDRGVVKELEDFGFMALQAAFEANAVHPYDRSNARDLWYAAFKAEGVPAPWPYPYQLKHSYLTEATIANPDNTEGVRDQSGLSAVSIIRYNEAGKQHVRRRVADNLGARFKELLGPAMATGKKKRGHAIFEKPVTPTLTPADYTAQGGPKRML